MATVACEKYPTHFLSIPLTSSQSRPALQASLQTFAQTARYRVRIPSQSSADTSPVNYDLRPIPASALRPTGTLHLRIGVYHLPDPESVAAAVDRLSRLDLRGLVQPNSTASSAPETHVGVTDKGIPHPGPITVRIQGLYAVHGPAHTSALYASAHDVTGRLALLCDGVRTALMLGSGSGSRSRLDICHADAATSSDLDPDIGIEGLGVMIVNTAPATKGGRRSPCGTKRKLDFVPAVDMFRDCVWAEDVVLKRIVICHIAAENVLDAEGRVVDQVFREVGSVPLM